jgi:tetratricopeptide (TPR) repeat protein
MSIGFDEYINEAQRYVAEGDYDGAIQMYKGALGEDPINEDIRREIINLNIRRGDYQQVIVEYFDWAEVCQAENEIDNAISTYREILNLENILVNTARDDEISDEIITQIRETIQAASGAIYFNMGYLSLEKNSLSDAIKFLLKSKEINPDDAKTRTLLGQVYMQEGQEKEANGEFQEVVRLSPDEAAYAYEMLGEINVKTGKITPGTVSWFKNAGDLYSRNEQYEDAVRAYERILSFESGNIEVFVRVADVYLKQNNKEKAIETYEKLARVYSDEGLFDKVIVVYEKILGWDPTNSEIKDKIIEIYRRILEVDASNLIARSKLIGCILRKGAIEEAIPEFVKLCETYFEKGMDKEALVVCKKLLDLDPKNIRAHEMHGDILFKQGNKELSLKEYLDTIRYYQENDDKENAGRVAEKIRNRFPDVKEVSLQMAIAYKEAGDFDRALVEFRKVITNEPDNLEVFEHVLEIYEQKNDANNIIQIANRIMELDESRIPELREKLLNIYEQKDNKDKVLEICQQIIDEEPTRVDIQQKMLQIYEETGSKEKAIVIYQQMLGNEPDRVDIRQKLIEHYAAESRIKDVLRESAALADIFMVSDEIDKAENLYKNVLAFMPGDVTTRERLIELYDKKQETGKVQDELLVLASIGAREENAEQVVQHYSKILEYVPTDLNIKIRVAKAASSCGLHEQAVTHYQDVIDDYLDKRMFEPAVNHINNLLDIDERNVVYRQKFIDILKEKFQIDEAIQHYKVLISHFVRMNQGEDAMVAASDAIALRPTDLDFRKEIVNVFLNENEIEHGYVLAKELIDVYLDHGDYDEVAELYDKLSHVYKTRDNVEEYYQYRENIAQVYERQSKYGEAIIEYLSIIEGHLMEGKLQEADRLFPLIINLYFKENRSGEAVESFRGLEEKLHRFGRIDESILTIEKLLHVLERREDWNESLDTLNRMIDYYKEMNKAEQVVETHQRIIEIFARLKDFDNAIKERFKIIEFYLNKQDVESAMFQFEEVERFDPENICFLYEMAEKLFNHNYHEQSKPLFERILEKDPENSDSMAKLAIIHAKAGSLEDVGVYTKKIFSKGMVADVIDAYKESKDVEQDASQIHINLGRFYQEMGFIEEAILEYQLAAQDPDKLLDAYNHMALCFKQEGYVDLAVKQLERSLAQPDYPEEEYLAIRYNLGEILLENKQLQEALSTFYECYMVDINYRDISEKIAKLNEQIAAESME